MPKLILITLSVLLLLIGLVLAIPNVPWGPVVFVVWPWLGFTAFCVLSSE